MMVSHLLTIACLLGLATIAKADKHCQGIFFRNEAYYDVRILREGVTELRSLTALRRFQGENRIKELYFTYTYIDKKVRSKTAYLTVDDKIFHMINAVNNTNTNCADDKKGIIYIGASDGIYTLNPANKTVVKTGISQDNVIDVSVNDNGLFYVTANNEIYIYNNYGNTRVNGLEYVKIKQIVFTNDNKCVFLTQDDTVGVGAISMSGTAYSSSFSTTNMRGKALSVDRNGVIYLCAPDALYEFNRSKDGFNKVADLPNLQGIVFGVDNTPFYAASGFLVQLIKNEVPCFGD